MAGRIGDLGGGRFAPIKGSCIAALFALLHIVETDGNRDIAIYKSAQFLFIKSLTTYKT